MEFHSKVTLVLLVQMDLMVQKEIREIKVIQEQQVLLVKVLMRTGKILGIQVQKQTL